MIRGLVRRSCSQCSPAHFLRQSLSTSAVVGHKGNGAHLRVSKNGQANDTFESNVKKRITKTEMSLEMPRTQHPSSEDIGKWRRIIQSPTLESLTAEDFSQLTSTPLPTWILMYLLVTKVWSPSHTTLVLDILYKNLYQTPESDQPYILILATRILAKLKAEPPMDRIVHSFLELPTPDGLQFNLLLRTMSHFRPSVHLAKLTTIILDTMQARQLRLARATYVSLLYNRFVTLEITKRLQERMHRDGLQPNAKELELFLRCFGNHGAFHTAARYVSFIRQMQLGQNKPASREEGSSTLVLNAFEYLRNLADDDAVLTATLQEEQKLVEPSYRGRSSSHDKHTIPGTSKWTAALHNAARDKRVSSDGLLVLLERSKSAGLAPTLATYTIIIGGLIKKNGDYARALKLWRELRRKVDVMDVTAMTVGLDVLIGSGRALEAFNLLRWRSGRRKNVPEWVITIPRDTALLNAFMSSLEEHGWPTAVFYCWDALYPLFNVRPDAVSLTILLRAAHVAERADASIRGLIGHIGMYNPFRSMDILATPPASSLSTTELEGRIRLCLHNKTVKRDGEEELDVTDEALKASTSSLWSGTPAGPKALKLFRSVLLGNFPHLRELNAPAKAVWSDSANDASPLRDVARGLGLARQENRPLGSSAGRIVSPFPQIAPDDRTFHAYIELLGSQRRSSEIPLALVWMRGLDLIPRKETVSLALVLFGEVSLRGPLLETYGTMSEYKKLIAWLKAWLGEESLPNESQLRHTFVHLQKDRGGGLNDEEESSD